MTSEQWRPSRTDARKLEFGTIERARREITISEACDLLNSHAALVQALSGFVAALTALRQWMALGLPEEDKAIMAEQLSSAEIEAREVLRLHAPEGTN